MKSYGDVTYRYLKGQWKRTLLTVLGIILSVALITAIGTMFISVRDYETARIIRNAGDYHVQYANVQGALVHKIGNSVAVSNTGVIGKQGYAIVGGVSDKERAQIDDDAPPYRYLSLRGYDEGTFKMFTIPLKEGRFPQASGELLVDDWVLEYLPGKPKLGDKIKLDVGTRYDGNSNALMPDYEGSSNEVFKKDTQKEFTIVGVAKPRVKSSINYFSNGITFLNSTDLVQDKNYEVYVKLASVKDVTGQAEAIAQAVGLDKQKGYSIEYNNSLLRMHAQSTNSNINSGLVKVLVFITILVILCTIAVIYNAFNISVLERISQFGVLRCVGATPGQIRNIVFKEAGILSILGIPIGLVCGVMAVQVVLCVINLLGNNALVFLDELQVGVSLPVFAVSALLGLVTVYLSAMGPARQAASISPLEAVRNTGSYKKENFKRVRSSRLVQYLFGVEGQIAFKNLRRNRKRFRIAVFSMVISIVLYIVFGSLIKFAFSFGAINYGAKVDFLLSRTETFTVQQYEEIKNLPGVEGVYKNMTTSIKMEIEEDKINPRFAELMSETGYLWQKKEDGSTLYDISELISYGEAATPDIQKILSEVNKSLDSMNRENGVILMVNNKIYDPVAKKWVIVSAFDYQVGDQIQIEVASESGEPQLKIVKVMAIIEKNLLDDGLNSGGMVRLITTDEVYENIAGHEHFNDMAIWLGQGADHERVAKYLKDFCKEGSVCHYMDISEEMARLRNAAITMSIFMYGFVAVVVLIGCLNIINTISTNLILRTRELSVLKAVGMTQNGIKKLVCMEGVLYGIISALYGSIIGSGLSYFLFKIVEKNMIEFQWSIPWEHIITAVVGAVLIALVSGYIPLKRINEGVIVENMRSVE